MPKEKGKGGGGGGDGGGRGAGGGGGGGGQEKKVTKFNIKKNFTRNEVWRPCGVFKFEFIYLTMQVYTFNRFTNLGMI
jgi:hypothetical protein